MMDEAPKPRELEERFKALGTVKQGYFTWPADEAFPWSDAECAAFVMGHLVKWPGTIDDLITKMPGKIELSGGYAMQYNT